MADKDYPNEYLQDFWKTLWHVDVYKDQKQLYEQAVVNGYLADGDKYSTIQPYFDKNAAKFKITGEEYKIADNRNISVNNATAGRKGGGENIIGFDDLFKYLTGKEFGKLSKKEVGSSEETAILNPNLMGPGIKYQIKVFDDKGNVKGNNELPDFVGNSIALFVDTTSHLAELLENYKKKGKDIIYAYTREIESDPADKTTYLSIGEKNKEQFYFEEVPPTNPTTVEYQPFTKTDGLSYFYCKYPVFLNYYGIKDDKKKTLKVQLSYLKGDKLVDVPEGANVAGAFSRIQSSIKNILGFKDAKEKLEISFISKHHGDVAQSLVKFRDVKLECPKNNSKLNSADYKAVFVSIDCNAIIKALTIGVPFIFMYPPDKKRIIVWKNESLNSPEEQYSSEKKYTLDQNTRFLEKQSKYNDKIEIIISSRKNLNDIITEKLKIDINKAEIEAGTLETIANKYKDYLKLGITIATLIKYVPKLDANIVKLESKGFEEDVKAVDESADDFIKKIEKLKEIQKKISDKESDFKIPEAYTTVQVVEGEELKTVSFEKDVRLEFIEVPKSEPAKKKGVVTLANKELEKTTKEFAKIRAGKEYSFKRGDNRVQEMWETTNLAYNYGDFSIESLLCRFGTKLNNSWAFDIINYIYTSINSYNEEYAKSLIDKIVKIVDYIPKSIQDSKKPEKWDTFRFGMELIELGELAKRSPTAVAPAEAASVAEGEVTVGGKRKLRRGGQTQVMLEQPSIEQKVETEEVEEERDEEDILLDAVTIELNDIYNHLKFMNTMIFLNKYKDNLSKVDFERYGLQAFNSFFQSVFSGKGDNDNKYYVPSSEFTTRSRLVQGVTTGGAETFTFLDEGSIKAIISFPKKAQETLPAEQVFDDKASFYTTMFSPILFYEQLISEDESVEKLDKELQNSKFQLEKRVERIKTRFKRKFTTKGLKTPQKENATKSLITAEDALKKIDDILKIINDSDQDEWAKEYSPTTNKESAGGRRLRKFKTYKKRRTNKKKTLKRF
jgi:hypothetical protein